MLFLNPQTRLLASLSYAASEPCLRTFLLGAHSSRFENCTTSPRRQYVSLLLRCTCGEPRAAALNLQARLLRARVRNHQNSKCSRGCERERGGGQRRRERDRQSYPAALLREVSEVGITFASREYRRAARGPLITIRVDVCHGSGRLCASSFVGPRRRAPCTWRVNEPLAAFPCKRIQ